MSKIRLFTDGSFNPPLKIGVGGFLILKDDIPEHEELKSMIQLKRFEQTTSSRLEIQTLLWAIEQMESTKKEIVVYTDAQSLIGLADRRVSLEQKNYHSNKGKLLKNHHEYREFFKLTDQHNCTFIKMRGHLPTEKKVN